jgi:hypothetical protein
MAFAKVMEIFDNSTPAKAAVHALLETRVATGATLRIEPEYLVEELHPLDSQSHKRLRDWLREWFGRDSDDDFRRYGQIYLFGRVLLVATVPEAQADKARHIMTQHGGILYIPENPHDHHDIRSNAIFDRPGIAAEGFGRIGMGAAH